MTIFQVIVLSIIEGLTEFLPISSTGHLILAQNMLSIPTTEFSKTFNIVIQLAAILAVVWLYRKNLFSSDKIWKRSIVAFIPTGIIGLIFYKFIRNTLLENQIITVYALLIGGLVLLLVDALKNMNQGVIKSKELPRYKLLLIGVFQSLSIIPGVSRSAASIVGGLTVGMSRTEAVEFSFYLAIPTMVMASSYDLLKSGINFSSQEILTLLIGCIFSFLSATVAVKAFIGFVKTNNFTVFAIYRIILAITVLLTVIR